MFSLFMHIMTYVYRMNFDDGRPPAHFDTFPIALLTVFQVKSLYKIITHSISTHFITNLQV